MCGLETANLMDKAKRHTTLSGVDEKPHKKAPVLRLYRGFLFYSLLTEAGKTLGCKVALRFEAVRLAISKPVLLRCQLLVFLGIIEPLFSFIALPVFSFYELFVSFLFFVHILSPLRPINV